MYTIPPDTSTGFWYVLMYSLYMACTEIVVQRKMRIVLTPTTMAQIKNIAKVCTQGIKKAILSITRCSVLISIQ